MTTKRVMYVPPSLLRHRLYLLTGGVTKALVIKSLIRTVNHALRLLSSTDDLRLDTLALVLFVPC